MGLNSQIYALGTLLVGEDRLVPIKLKSGMDFSATLNLGEDMDTNSTVKIIGESI
jgi:hypothetical protein